MAFPEWEQPSHCTGGPTPGALALARWIMEDFGDDGAMNWGIYNCRSIRGGETTSAHGEGRAFDCGFAVSNPDGDRLLRLLLKCPGRLGIQAIIYERKIYSAKSPAGRYYGGIAPHYDHLHIELTRESAQKLTYATVVAVIAAVREPKHRIGTRDLHLGDRGADVRFVQKRVGALIDGVYGPNTKNLVLAFERHHKRRYPRLVVDGVVGRLTWHVMGVKPKY